MSKLVDQDGKPFTPSLIDEIFKGAGHRFKNALLEASKPSKFVEDQRIAELRKSCGVEPEQKTITFRRPLPYGTKPE